MCMNSINVGNIVKGQITGVTPYGVFVSLEDDYSGLVHISEVSDYKVEESLSRIPETGSGFGLLEKNLGKWTASKLKEITKNKKNDEKNS